jgi:phenylalanyl-tRNA synthetase beta chain
MPTSVLERARVLELLPVPVSESQLDDLLFFSKAELEGRDADHLTVAVTPDRLDLLSEGGLALHLQGALDLAHGVPPLHASRAEEGAVAFDVEASVDPLRPHLAGVVVRAPTDAGLDAGLLAEAIRFQEILHDSIGRDRRAASLGVYPLDRLSPPIRYALEPMSGVRFVPLDASDEIDARDFFATHPMAARFGADGRSGDACLTLRDARGTVLSLPPILNSRAGGEARVGDRTLLLESTGTRAASVREALGLLLVVFAARGWAAAPVVRRPASGGSAGSTDPLTPRHVDLAAEILEAVSGAPLSSAEVEARFARARLSPKAHAGGWRVTVPPWRPDLTAPVDLAEEVVIAGPIRPEDGVIPPSRSRGRRRPETVFRRRFATALLGLGLAAPHTSLLVSEESVARLPGATPIRLARPVSAEFAYLRDRLLLSHLDVLGRNTRHGYPQRFGEVGPVLVADPAAESGADTRYRAGVLLASETAGFADAAGIVEYLLRAIDVIAVREPAELPGGIPGRTARARLAGETVAELGEVHPRVLAALGVPVPAAWAEVDLSALWTLAGRREGA